MTPFYNLTRSLEERTPSYTPFPSSPACEAGPSCLYRRKGRGFYVRTDVPRSWIDSCPGKKWESAADSRRRGPWGWALLIAIWVLAVDGIVFKATLGFRYPKMSAALYLVMGWLVLIAIHTGSAGFQPA